MLLQKRQAPPLAFAAKAPMTVGFGHSRSAAHIAENVMDGEARDNHAIFVHRVSERA
jgi:hypothetical protein